MKASELRPGQWFDSPYVTQVKHRRHLVVDRHDADRQLEVFHKTSGQLVRYHFNNDVEDCPQCWDDEPQSEPDVVDGWKTIRNPPLDFELQVGDEYRMLDCPEAGWLPIAYNDLTVDMLFRCGCCVEIRRRIPEVKPAPLQLREGAWYRSVGGDFECKPIDWDEHKNLLSKEYWEDIIQFEVGGNFYNAQGKNGGPFASSSRDLVAEVPPPVEPEPRKGPSEAWLRAAAEREDGKCISVGGLAVELGLYKHPVHFTNGSWYWNEWLLEHQAYAIKRGDNYLQSDSEHGSGFTRNIRQAWTPSQMAKIDATLLDGCEPVLVAEREPIELPDPRQPDADGWIEWKGGECPVDENALVECMFENGVVMSLMAAKFVWRLFLHRNNIVAYRLVQPAPQPLAELQGAFKGTGIFEDAQPEETKGKPPITHWVEVVSAMPLVEGTPSAWEVK